MPTGSSLPTDPLPVPPPARAFALAEKPASGTPAIGARGFSAASPPAPWQVVLPNCLIVVRLVLAGVLIGFLTFWRYPSLSSPDFALPTAEMFACAAVFILAAVTDAVDGFLARRWRVTSKFGRVMDPFADKVLVLGSLVVLAGPAFNIRVSGVGLQVSGVGPWMVVLMLGRELLVTSLRGLIESKGLSFAATASGKWKMILQSVVVPMVLIILGLTTVLPGTWGRWTIDLSVWLTVAVTVLSAGPYISRAIIALRTSDPDDHHHQSSDHHGPPQGPQTPAGPSS